MRGRGEAYPANIRLNLDVAHVLGKSKPWATSPFTRTGRGWLTQAVRRALINTNARRVASESHPKLRCGGRGRNAAVLSERLRFEVEPIGEVIIGTECYLRTLDANNG